MSGNFENGESPELTGQSSSILATAGRLFDAAADASLWPRFLSGFAAEFGAFAGQIVYVDHRAVDISISCLVGLSADIVESLGPRYRELAFYDDLRSPFSLSDRRHPAHGRFTSEEIQAFQNGRASHCRMLLDDETWHATSMYREVCRPAGIEYGLTIVRNLTDEWSLNLALMRGPGDGPFTLKHCRRLEAWLPHLERALHIHRRLEGAAHDLDVAYSVLDTLNVGVLIVDDLLELRYTNPVARKLLGRGDGIRASRHRLLLADRVAQQQLVDAARHQAARDERDCGEYHHQPIIINGQERRPAYSLLLTPVWQCLRADPNCIRGRPGIVVFVSPCEQQRYVEPFLLEDMWGLTRAEARVVQRLLSGASVGQAARALSVTDNTVRKHLKAVFSKTGTRSQADLIRSVAGSAAWFVSTGNGHESSRKGHA